ncbi:hypothetical protein HMPREF9056_01341 [Actinomyces sp. oral taxon 170 str. F0386]|nr:hypothetical protein HMPREF9056_01341 [Actinomyces sp. oral taxon 170 str. F0386]
MQHAVQAWAAQTLSATIRAAQLSSRRPPHCLSPRNYALPLGSPP